MNKMTKVACREAETKAKYEKFRTNERPTGKMKHRKKVIDVMTFTDFANEGCKKPAKI